MPFNTFRSSGLPPSASTSPSGLTPGWASPPASLFADDAPPGLLALAPDAEWLPPETPDGFLNGIPSPGSSGARDGLTRDTGGDFSGEGPEVVPGAAGVPDAGPEGAETGAGGATGGSAGVADFEPALSALPAPC